MRFAFVLAVAACLAGCGQPSQPQRKAELGILTGMPLFWREGDQSQTLAGEDERAPIIKMISNHYRVRSVDALSDATLKPLPMLMLAQPKTLAAAELVALDLWVQRGGSLLIFADPFLDWPSDLPLGDARRPPVVTLLDPLFEHWGLGLAAPTAESNRPHIIQLAGVSAVVQSEGVWTSRSNSCSRFDKGLRLECRVGKGFVILVGDADILDFDLGNVLNVDNGIAIDSLLDRLALRTRKEQRVENEGTSVNRD